MEKISQKEAVYNAVLDVFAKHNIYFEAYKTSALAIIEEDRELGKEIVTTIVAKFLDGTVEVQTSPENINNYCSGLMRNWLRKDPRLNGGYPYEKIREIKQQREAKKRMEIANNTDKICPILSLGAIIHGGIESERLRCLQYNCEFYIDSYNNSDNQSDCESICAFMNVRMLKNLKRRKT